MKAGRLVPIIVCGLFLLSVSFGYTQQTTEGLLREALDPGEPMPEEDAVVESSPEIEVMPATSAIESATEEMVTETAEQVREETPSLTLSELIRMQSRDNEAEEEIQESEPEVSSGTSSLDYDIEYPSKPDIDRETALQELEAAERAEDVTPAMKVYEIALGEKAMTFALPTSMGKEVSVPDGIQADRIVLAFFRGPWDPYAEAQLKGFAGSYNQIQMLGAKVVAISSGPAEPLAAMRKDNLLPFPVLVDEDFNVSRAYKTYKPSMRMVFPSLFILDKDGTILFFQRGQMGTDYVQTEQLLELLDKYESQ